MILRKEERELIVEAIRTMIQEDDSWTRKALSIVYSLQTSEEQRDHQTKELNGVGFTGFDAAFLSSLAEWLRTKGWLSPKQTAAARKKMPKYAGQVTDWLSKNDPAFVGELVKRGYDQGLI